eukprot:1129568-Prorocentrum_minimum.AAC.1
MDYGWLSPGAHGLGHAADAAAGDALQRARADGEPDLHAADHPADPEPGRLLQRQHPQAHAAQRALVQGAPAAQDLPRLAARGDPHPHHQVQPLQAE